MIHETIPLTVPGADGPAELTAYAPGNFPELGERRLRSAVIICPASRTGRGSRWPCGSRDWALPPFC